MNIIQFPDNGLTAISLFAGCGGSSLGYKMAGYDVRLAVEWDAGAAAVYRRNFPDTPIYQGDIGDLSVSEALTIAGLKPGELDILDGSPPCQGFSIAGKRKFSDSRNQLFHEYVRMVEGLQPRVFVMENVSGMIKGKMKLMFAEITRALKATGYSVSCRLLNAWWYGVPQDRKRLIWIGVRKGLATHPPPVVSIPATCKILDKGKDEGGPALTNLAKQYWPIMRPGESAAKYHPKGLLFGLTKLNPERPAPTLIKSAGASNLCHWLYPRYLNCQEAAILQGFPSWFVFPDKVNLWRNLIGNSVCPPMAEAIGNHLSNLLVTG
jgi:DNA (cytosine-5)-methyltransferase 1